MMDKQACFDPAALVKAAALEVHAQQPGLHQTEFQWEDPQRGWPLATAAARERTEGASHAPITSRGDLPKGLVKRHRR